MSDDPFHPEGIYPEYVNGCVEPGATDMSGERRPYFRRIVIDADRSVSVSIERASEGRVFPVRCEGSGCATVGPGLCSMCGRVVVDGLKIDLAPEHDRPDILAMLDRGDFDEPAGGER